MTNYTDSVEITDKDIYKLIDRSKEKVDKNILIKALTIAGMTLRDSTKRRLLKKMPKAATAKGREKDTTMAEGIRVSKNEAGGYVNVYILGNYMNRWFERGTDRRKLKQRHKKDDKHHRTYKKGENRGSIKALNYFREALTQDMGKVRDKIIEIIDREIDKTLNDNTL